MLPHKKQGIPEDSPYPMQPSAPPSHPSAPPSYEESMAQQQAPRQTASQYGLGAAGSAFTWSNATPAYSGGPGYPAAAAGYLAGQVPPGQYPPGQYPPGQYPPGQYFAVQYQTAGQVNGVPIGPGTEVHIPGAFSAGARFDGHAQPRIPPPPPGVAPNAAQVAAMSGASVVTTQRASNKWVGGAGGGAVFW